MTQQRYRKRKTRKILGPYPFELRLQVFKMYLEEQYPIKLISKEIGVGKSRISAWSRKYRD